MIDTLRATDKLMGQFDQPTELLDQLTLELGSKQEAIAGITETVATTFIAPGDALTLGHEARQLSDWHRELQADCTTRYWSLRRGGEDTPPLSREEANQEDELLTLNGIRRGIGRAMRRSYKLAGQQKERKFRLEYGIDEVEPYEKSTELSDEIKDTLSEAREVARRQRPKAILAALAGGTVAVVGEVAFSGDARVGTYFLGGGLALYSGARRLLTKFAVEDLENDTVKAEHMEEVATILPKVKPPFGLDYAVRALNLRSQELDLQSRRASAIGEYLRLARETHAVGSIMANLVLCDSQEQAIGRIVRDLLYHLDNSTPHKNDYHHEELETRTALLDEFVPIDQAEDALTPSIAGKKKWIDYIKVLAHPDSQLDRQKLDLLLV